MDTSRLPDRPRGTRAGGPQAGDMIALRLRSTTSGDTRRQPDRIRAPGRTALRFVLRNFRSARAAPSAARSRRRAEPTVPRTRTGHAYPLRGVAEYVVDLTPPLDAAAARCRVPRRARTPSTKAKPTR